MCELLKSLSKMVKLGEGDMGAIYDVGNNRVMKVTRELVDGQILELASSSGIGPRIFGFEKCADGQTYYIQQKLIHPFSAKYLPQLPELVTKMFEAGLIHNDLHTENMMADEKGRLYLIDFDMSDLVSRVGLSQRSVQQHSKYLDMTTDERIPILFTEDQKNRIKNIQERDSVKQAEIDSKLRIQKARDDAMKQVEARKLEALKRINRT